MSKVKLILARHGETVENGMKILQGHCQGHLTRNGKAQAVLLAEKMRSEIIDAVVCSDLARSYDTAGIVAEVKGLVPVRTPLLREKDWGKMTGMYGDEARLAEKNVLEDSGMETDAQMYARAARFLDFIRENYAGKTVLAVGHGCFNRAVRACAGECGAENVKNMPFMPNTGFVTLELECGSGNSEE